MYYMHIFFTERLYMYEIIHISVSACRDVDSILRDLYPTFGCHGTQNMLEKVTTQVNQNAYIHLAKSSAYSSFIVPKLNVLQNISKA